jgi:ribosomal protein S18 acetylase RimI-like enzyme
VSALVVRRVRPGDAEVLRTVRLGALADAPSAFGSTHADEVVRPESHWTTVARERSAGLTAANFLAMDGARAVGIIGAYRDDGVDDVVELVSMWVEPAFRGGGVADLLVAEVLAFAEAAGVSHVELWVTVGNDRARRFYERHGFVGLDDFAPLPSDPCADEQRMRRAL